MTEKKPPHPPYSAAHQSISVTRTHDCHKQGITYLNQIFKTRHVVVYSNHHLRAFKFTTPQQHSLRRAHLHRYIIDFSVICQTRYVSVRVVYRPLSPPPRTYTTAPSCSANICIYTRVTWTVRGGWSDVAMEAYRIIYSVERDTSLCVVQQQQKTHLAF